MKGTRENKKKQSNKSMKLYKEDIVNIGNYAEERDGNVDIMAYYPGVNSDEILLRAILLKFGGYRIVEVICYEDVLCYRTNLPYDIYLLARDNYVILNNRKI